jgi:hypothetical protein
LLLLLLAHVSLFHVSRFKFRFISHFSEISFTEAPRPEMAHPWAQLPQCYLWRESGRSAHLQALYSHHTAPHIVSQICLDSPMQAVYLYVGHSHPLFVPVPAAHVWVCVAVRPAQAAQALASLLCRKHKCCPGLTALTMYFAATTYVHLNVAAHRP